MPETEDERTRRLWAEYRDGRTRRRRKGWFGITVFGLLCGTLWSMPFAVSPHAKVPSDKAPFAFALGVVVAIFLGSIVMTVYESRERRRVFSRDAWQPPGGKLHTPDSDSLPPPPPANE